MWFASESRVAMSMIYIKMAETFSKCTNVWSKERKLCQAMLTDSHCDATANRLPAGSLLHFSCGPK